MKTTDAFSSIDSAFDAADKLRSVLSVLVSDFFESDVPDIRYISCNYQRIQSILNIMDDYSVKILCALGSPEKDN